MFTLRRRTVATATASDLPFCTMCGQNIRVDAASGRCALGHRVLAIQTFAPVPSDDEVTEALQPAPVDETVQIATVTENDFTTEPLPVVDSAAGYAGEGLYEAYHSADAATGHSVTWDDVVAPSDAAIVYDDYVSWDEPSTGFSSLDVDTESLPVATDEVEDAEDADNADEADAEPAPYEAPVTPLNELLDELDDAAAARRKAVGTIGATIAVSSVVFASLALLPF